MEKKIQEAAKQKVVELLKDYDVSYIDYDTMDNDYTIRLETKQTKDDKRIKGLTIELPKEDKQPLLQITLDEYGKVPKVLYKGEEVSKKVEVDFKWTTKDSGLNSGITKFSITHGEEERDKQAVKTISYNPVWEYE